MTMEVCGNIKEKHLITAILTNQETDNTREEKCNICINNL